MSNHVGIIGALPQEIAKLKEHVENQVTHVINKHITLIEGTLHGKKVVFSPSNIGLVFASSVVTTMVNIFHVRAVIFTGVGGGLKSGQSVGDIIVAKDVINYEFNCKNFFLPWDPSYRHKLGEIPFVGICSIPCDEKLTQLAMNAPHPAGKKYTYGRVATGQEFVNVQRKLDLQAVWDEVGNPDVVEMEGIAIAQVCHSYEIPFVLLRAISDTIEGNASDDFNAFAQTAADELWPIVDYIVANL
eukprot:TRINITY_DN8242_c0_g1_i1.p1 TRINITY_DN8242_c0_g1~~TRINITY_DN8242_c0_g1_i1.p1  ORF type:complete len:244 (+),score=59.34 TRINITY_DN8242_c0_g1_i1:83-814(+)